MVVLKNASENENLTRGTKVLTVNQIPVLDIRKAIIKYGDLNVARIQFLFSLIHATIVLTSCIHLISK